MEIGWNIVAELVWGFEVLMTIACVVYLLLVLFSSETAGDRGIIKTVIAYLLLFVFIILASTLYKGAPSFYVRITPLFLLALTTWPVTLYKIVCGITNTDGGKPFSPYHFALPLILTVIWTIITSGIPFDLRVGIIRSFAQPAPGYEGLSAYFTSLGLHQLIFELVYISLSFVRLSAYHRRIARRNKPDSRYRLHWLTTVITLSVALTLTTVIMLFTGDRKIYLHPLKAVLSGSAYTAVIFILTLNVLRRNYPPRKPVRNLNTHRYKLDLTSEVATTGTENTVTDEPEEVSTGRHGVKLDKRELEAFFHNRKPYLDPGLTLVGLAEELNTNRVVLSGFINKTYGANFNTYVNGWRLQELNRLRKHKKYKDLPLVEMIKLAGFGSYDSYRRSREGDSGKEVQDGV